MRKLVASTVLSIGLLCTAALVSQGQEAGRTCFLNRGAQDTAKAFSLAMSQSNGPGVQAQCSSALWGRLQARFASNPAPGALGSFQFLDGIQVSSDRVMCYVLCTHADGVEDVITITLRQTADQWKVVGGPSGCTPN